MKRKVIQIANSTQLVSLPRKWAIKYEIKKGDELDLQIQGNKLIVKPDGEISNLKTVDLDITSLDRSSVMHAIRSFYRLGYDEIKVTFNKPTTTHFRLNIPLNFISVIHQEVNRLVGVEIIQQKDNFCLIKDISKSSIKEFDGILRRIFLLLSDASKDLLNIAKNNDYVLAETIEQKHDTITKFASYCLRLLNRYGYHESNKTAPLYHIIASLDKIIDIIKYVSRDVLKYKPKLTEENIKILTQIDAGINYYYNLFYKFDMKNIIKFMEYRNHVIKAIKDGLKKNKPEVSLMLNDMSYILELLLDLTEAKISL